MTGRRVIVSILTLTVAACGDLSPATPTDIEREPVLSVSPIRARRLNSVIDYTVGYNFMNPKAATAPITVTRAEFTILGADGSSYGISQDPLLTFGRTVTLRPGEFLTGSGTLSDANTTRPTATTYTIRVFFTRSDGSTWQFEERSTILPVM